MLYGVTDVVEATEKQMSEVFYINCNFQKYHEKFLFFFSCFLGSPAN